jgi:chromosome partitioning protein
MGSSHIEALVNLLLCNIQTLTVFLMYVNNTIKIQHNSIKLTNNLYKYRSRPKKPVVTLSSTCTVQHQSIQRTATVLLLSKMPIVIAVANQKGGCGKTTVSMNIAGVLAREGEYRVLLIDADPQASAMQWRKNCEDSALPFDLRPFPHPVLHKEIAKLAAEYDIVFIDCPPGGGQSAAVDVTRDICRSALRAADVVLVPIRPTPLDYHASHTLLPMIRDVAFLNEHLRVFIVINGKTPGRTRLGQEAAALASELFQVEGVSITVLKHEICTRQTFAQSPLVGQVVVDYESNSKASDEIRTITEELIQCLATEAQASAV